MHPIQIALVVDDFCVKYRQDHAEHLLAVLKEHYTMTTDWNTSLFCGIQVQWDYVECTVKVSMPGYVEASLQKFQHPWLVCLEDSSY